MQNADDERDLLRDTEDADLTNSEHVEEEEEEEERDEDHDSDDSDEDEDSDDEKDEDEESDEDEDSDEDDSDEEDDKPVTRKELREMLKKNSNNRNAERRVSSKKRTEQPGSDADRRLAALEEQQRKNATLEKKRDFGYAHNLSPKQVNFVFRQTKRPTEKFLNRPEIRAGLDAIKASEKVSNNTPSNSGKVFKDSVGKEKAWTELSPDERQGSLADRRREILARKRGQ